MFTFISNNGLYDDVKKMTKNDSVDHISENDRTRVIMGWLVATATPLRPILNQKLTENIGNFRLLASMFFSFKKRCQDFGIWIIYYDF